MRAVIEALDLRNITLVCQDWGGLIGLRLAAEDAGSVRARRRREHVPADRRPAARRGVPPLAEVLAGDAGLRHRPDRQQAARRPTSRPRSSPPTTRRSPTIVQGRRARSSRCSCRRRPTIRPRRPTAPPGRCSSSGRSRSSPRSATPIRSPAAATACSRRRSPAPRASPHDDRRRRPLPPGGPRPAARARRRRLHPRHRGDDMRQNSIKEPRARSGPRGTGLGSPQAGSGEMSTRGDEGR